MYWTRDIVHDVFDCPVLVKAGQMKHTLMNDGFRFSTVAQLNFQLFRGREPGRGALKACPICLPHESLESWSKAELDDYMKANEGKTKTA